MFWASSHGKTKGPCLFWEKSSLKEDGNKTDINAEKEWGYVTAEKYQKKMLTLIKAYIDQLNDEGFKFQQDNAPTHAAASTVKWLKDNGLWDRTIWWPAKSPDLNPIENVWRYMKEIISRRDPIGRLKGKALRKAVEEA